MKKLKWDNKKRQAQAKRLGKALVHERKAIAAIAQAMAAEGIEVPAVTAPADTAYPKVELTHVEKVFKEVFAPNWQKQGRWRWRTRSYVYMQHVCARAAGWDVDYDTLMTVSGVAGSFAYHHKEFVVNYHMPGPVDKHIAKATGFGFEWKRYKTAETYWKALKQTIDAGKPVHAPYGEEVLLIGYQDAPRKADRKVRPLAVVFVEPNAWWTWAQFEDWFKKHSHGMLGRHTQRVKALSPKESALNTLRLLVEYATTDPRAQIDRFKKNGSTFGLTGLETYAADIADLSKSGKKEVGYFQGGWRGCHNIYPQLGGRWSTENYLTGLAKSGALNKVATGHVQAAAKAYHAACMAWEEWETHLGDRQKRPGNDGWTSKTHRLAGAAALRKAIAHEKAGLAEIRKALAAEGVEVAAIAAPAATPARVPTRAVPKKNPKAKIKRGKGAAQIQGVPILTWATGKSTSYAGALEAALAVTEHPYDYADIMGYSGLAFRVRWGPKGKGWCPSVPVGEFPEEVAATARNTGWVFHSESHMDEEKNPRMERYAADMVASIDAGWPVVGYGRDMNVGVAYGYEDGGKTFLWRDFFKGRQLVRLPVEKTGPWLLFLTGYRQPPKDRLVDALKIAVTNWHRVLTPSPAGNYGYTWGADALARWQDDLTHATKFPKKEQGGLHFLNWWNYATWADARVHGAKFLARHAKLLKGNARQAVERAAAIYDEEAKWLLKPFKTKTAFHGPWTGKRLEHWTAAVRKRELAILTDALKRETRAVAELEKALAAEGIDVPKPPAGGAARAKPPSQREAERFVADHARLDAFQKWPDAKRRHAVATAMGIAWQFSGTRLGARALMVAAAAHTGQCDGTRPLGADGWDRAIALYGRVVKEYPDTHEAGQARWVIATCYACWARWDCCRWQNQGKGDLAKAIALYRELYTTATDPGSKCNALRRIAEVQCNLAGQWREGLATYRQLAAEFPGDVPSCPYETCRTCGSPGGTWLLDYDLADLTFRELVAKAKTAKEAVTLRDEFVKLVPRPDAVAYQTLWLLGQRLRQLKDVRAASRIDKQLGLCDAWLVVGPFSKGQAGKKTAPLPAFLKGKPGDDHWSFLDDPMRHQIRDAFAPEKDVLAGKLDLAKAYNASTADGKRGKCLWIRSDRRPMHKTWTARGAFYALAYVESPKAQAAQLRVALSGFARVWLNGKPVLDTALYDYPTMDQDRAAVRLKRGRNVLLVKFVQWDSGDTQFVRLTDKQGDALPGVTYAVPAVPATNRQRSDFLAKASPPPEPPGKTVAKMDVAKLKLKGQGHAQDSFSLVMQAAARVLGRRADYETIYALSTNAFALGIRPDESCKAWWTMYGRDQCMQLVAGRLGLKARKIALPDAGIKPGDAEAAWKAELAKQRKACLPVLRQAVGRGEVVITGGSWQVRLADGSINPWCWWGIITEARDDGTILGACLNGRTDNPLEGSDHWWALSPADDRTTPRDADMVMLKAAVARIRGNAAPFRAGGIQYGLPGMDLWIKHMGTVPFCPDCKEHSWKCATSTAQPMLVGAKVAAKYLKECRKGFSEKASTSLVFAAIHYERIAALLEPFGTWGKTNAYQALMGDQAKQKAHAAKVLVAVKAELGAAGDLLAQALATEGVKVPAGAAPARTGRRVLLKPVVDDFQRLIGKYGHHSMDVGGVEYVQPCVYLAFHLLQMHAAGWADMDFDTLAAVSGTSALFGYKPKDFMPKYANTCIGFGRRITEATGFGYEHVTFTDAEGAWAHVKASVDSGRSCRGADWESILFAGYQEAPTPEGRRVFAMADGPATYARWLTWLEFTEWCERVTKWKDARLGRHTKRVKKTARKDVALQVLRDLVTWSVKPPGACVKRFPKATWGLAGMEAYASDCENTVKFAAWGVCHETNPQIHVRNSTAVYLARLADTKTFPKKVNDHLREAAKQYKAAYQAWCELYELLGHGATKAQRQAKSRRQAGAAAVRRAAAHERAGLEAVRHALGAAGVRTSTPKRT